MEDTDPRVASYFAQAKHWPKELAALRAILRRCPVSEVFKWRSPCYTVDGSAVATVWDFKEACTLGFFKGVLLKDPDGVLVAQGEHSRSMRVMTFTDAADVIAREAQIRAYLDEAIANERAGLKVDLPREDIPYPDELMARFDDDPDLRAAFEALTPGRRRAYLIHFSQAKQSATRIDKATPRILAGKGMTDR